MKNNLIAILFILVIFIGLPLAVVFLKDKIVHYIWRRKNPLEKVASERKEYEEKIKNPDWMFYEWHLQRPIPDQIRVLYGNEPVIISGGFDYDENTWISSFEAISKENLLGKEMGFDVPIVPILTTGFGDPVYFKPGSKEANTLYVTYHDGGDTEVFESSLDKFVQKISKANQVPSGNPAPQSS